MNIIEFLEARIDEDEVRASSGWARLGDSRWKTDDYGREFLTPAAALAECAAKRKLIAISDQVASMDYQITQEWGGVSEPIDGTADDMLKAMAAVYADNPDYNKEWAL